MELSDRKKKILQILVEEYILEGTPVSSKKLHEKHLNEYSPATIRNELFSLEELGYLSHTHTSSGRVPLPKAYRLYVDKLMEKGSLSLAEINYIESHFTKNFTQAEDIVKNAAKVISELTNYTAIGFSEDSVDENIEGIRLVRLNAKNILLIIITNSHFIKDTVITCEYEITDSYIETAEKILSEVFQNKTIEQAANIDEQLVEDKIKVYKELFNSILQIFKNYTKNDNAKVVLEGSSNILNYDEFMDKDKTKNFLSVIEKPEHLLSILKSENNGLEISVKIGNDDTENLSDDLALVTANYKVNGKTLASSGVLGPIRMDYNRVFLVLDMIKKAIENIKED